MFGSMSGGVSTREVRPPLGEGAEEQAQLEAGQVGADAEVGALPEGEVRVGVAADVEAERVVEHGLVAVGRRVGEHHPVARLHRLLADVVVGEDAPEHVVERRHPADDLLDQAGHEGGVGGGRLPLVGVLGEDRQAAGDDGAGGLGAAGDEQARSRASS